MARQSVSKHLAILEAAGLVTTVRHGREKLHYLNAAPINEIGERWISHYDRGRAEALADLKRALEEPPMSERPTFVYTTYIRTTPEQLWKGLTDPAFTKRYWNTTFETDAACAATAGRRRDGRRIPTDREGHATDGHGRREDEDDVQEAATGARLARLRRGTRGNDRAGRRNRGRRNGGRLWRHRGERRVVADAGGRGGCRRQAGSAATGGVVGATGSAGRSGSNVTGSPYS